MKLVDFNTHVDTIMTNLESVTHYFEMPVDDLEQVLHKYLAKEYEAKLRELGSDVDIDSLNDTDTLQLYRQKIVDIKDFIADISFEIGRNGTEKCEYYYED